MSAGLEAWGEANLEVQAACRLLTDPTPENLDRCSVALTSAISRVKGADRGGTQVMMLHTSVQRARSLLESAASFHHGWQRTLLALTAGGYNAAGNLAPLGTKGRLFLQG